MAEAVAPRDQASAAVVDELDALAGGVDLGQHAAVLAAQP